MEIASLKKDASAIAGGQWVNDIPEMGDLELRVRGFSSPQVIALRSRLERSVPKSDKNRDGSLKPEAAIRIMKRVLHEAVLLEWRGLTDGGAPVPYSSEQAGEWISNDDYRTFADAVTWAANAVDNGNAESTEELAKNSQKPSAGK